MARTQPRGGQLLDASIQRDDLDSATVGQAVIRKAVEGTGIQLTSTGGDVGTGDVTIATRNTTGTLASRPAAGNSGAWYFATDVAGGVLFRDTGSAWVAVSPSAGVSATALSTFTGTSQAASTDVTIIDWGSVPANGFLVGSVLDIRVGLDIDIINSATARNVQFKLKIGGTALLTFSLVVATSTGVTNSPGYMTFVVTSYGPLGASAVFRGEGLYVANVGAQRSAALNSVTAGITRDTTGSLAVILTVNETVNSVADVIRGQQGILFMKV